MTDNNEFTKLVEQMTDTVYEQLRSAVEIGRWEDGRKLSVEQQEQALQLVMLYQAKKMTQTDHFTINSDGKINELSKSELKRQFEGELILFGDNTP